MVKRTRNSAAQEAQESVVQASRNASVIDELLNISHLYSKSLQFSIPSGGWIVRTDSGQFTMTKDAAQSLALIAQSLCMTRKPEHAESNRVLAQFTFKRVGDIYSAGDSLQTLADAIVARNSGIYAHVYAGFIVGFTMSWNPDDSVSEAALFRAIDSDMLDIQHNHLRARIVAKYHLSETTWIEASQGYNGREAARIVYAQTHEFYATSHGKQTRHLLTVRYPMHAVKHLSNLTEFVALWQSACNSGYLPAKQWVSENLESWREACAGLTPTASISFVEKQINEYLGKTRA
jgi:hypothetical protein